jgi:hypothetical protein
VLDHDGVGCIMYGHMAPVVTAGMQKRMSASSLLV